MKRNIAYLICIVVLPILASCSKEDQVPVLTSGEAKVIYETGISFTNSSGFEADYVIFKLRVGSGTAKEHGQSLDGYNYTKLQEGSKAIYQASI